MVLNSGLRDDIKEAALDLFDSITHIGFSDGLSSEASSSNTLTGEFLRKELEDSFKSVATSEYTFDGVLGLTEGNSEVLSKTGFFTDLSGDTLQLSKLLPVSISKDSEKEINMGMMVTISLVDNT